MRLQTSERSLLVDTHQSAVAGDIGRQNGRQPSLDTRSLAKPAAPDKLESFFTSRINHTDNAFREPLAIARSCTLSPQLRAPQSLAEEAEAAHPVRSWEAADHALQCPM
jgi:hypothetical protein